MDGLLIRTITETTSKEGTKQTKLSLIPAASVQRGSLLLCAPGELLPVSAQLVDSDGEFSLDWIMGESVPVHHQQGAVIPAGAHNRGQTAVKLRAEEAFSASQLRDLLCAPSRTQTLPGDEAAPADSTLGTEFWDFLSRYYVAAVLTLAALAFALWWHAGALRATGAAGLGAIRAGATLGSATQTAFALGQAASGATGLGGIAAGLGGIARAGAAAATHGVRSAVGRVGDAVSEGVDAGRAVVWQATGGAPAASSDQASAQFAASSAAPDWARRLRAEQAGRAHRHAAAQAIKDGDRPGSPANPDLHMKED